MEFKKGKYYGTKEEGYALLKVRASSTIKSGIIATGFDSCDRFRKDEMFMNTHNHEFTYEITGDEAKILEARIELELKK